MSIDQYSHTPNSNDLTGYFRTGMRPSAVKTAGWDIMADLASYVVALPAAAGTATAITVANGRPFGSLVTGLMQILNPTLANTGAATFAPDGLTAAPIFTGGAALGGGEMQPNIPVMLKYDGTNWNLLNPQSPGENLFVDPCCRIASRGNSSAKNLTTGYKYGNVDLVQMKGSGTAVSAGTITQDIVGTMTTAATAFSCKIAGATITGTGKVFFRRWIESADAITLKNKNVIFNILVRHNVGTTLNTFVTVNKAAGGVNDFSSVTTIGINSTAAAPTATDTLLSTGQVAMGDCSNGVEVIVEIDCGAVTTKDFYATDWRACPTVVARTCAVPKFNDDLMRAMRYYEQSYAYGTQEGTAAEAGATEIIMPVATANGIRFFGLNCRYRVEKPAAATVTLYSSNDGTSGKVYDADGATNVTSNAGTNAATGFIPTNASGGVVITQHRIIAQFVADARL